MDSILTGSNSAGSGQDRPFSDTSSDSGCNIEQQILSPDLIDYIPNQDAEDDDDGPLHAVVNPRTNSPEPEVITNTFETGATTIILPVINSVHFP